MEALQHIGKFMVFLAACSMGYELISNDSKLKLNRWLTANLNQEQFVLAFSLLAVSVVTIHIFIHFAGFITAIVAGLLFGIPYVLLLVAVVRINFLLFFILGIPISFLTAGLAWLLSTLTPQLLLDNAFFPYAIFASLMAKLDSSVLLWFVPQLNMEAFLDNFKNINDALYKANTTAMPSFAKYISPRYWWNIVYHDNTAFPLLVSIVCTQIVYFFGLFLFLRLIFLSMLFPLFQAADAIKRITKVEKEHFPAMGILLGMCGGIIEYLTFLLSG